MGWRPPSCTYSTAGSLDLTTGYTILRALGTFFSRARSAMDESSSCPHFGCAAVLPLGQEDFHLNGSGSIVFAVENLRSLNLPIAVAEVGPILRHRWQTLKCCDRETEPLHRCCRTFGDLYLRLDVALACDSLRYTPAPPARCSLPSLQHSTRVG